MPRPLTFRRAAIPSAAVLATTLLLTGQIPVPGFLSASPGWLGVFLSAGVDHPEIAEVVPGSPAADVGLKPGDRVLRVAGERTPSLEGFVAAMEKRSVGEKVRLEVDRNGAILRLFVTLTERPDPDSASGQPGDAEPMKDPWGFELAQAGDRVRVVRVTPEGAAARAGLEVGDVIEGMQGEPIDGVNMANDRLMAGARAGDRLDLGVRGPDGPRQLLLEGPIHAEGVAVDDGNVESIAPAMDIVVSSPEELASALQASSADKRPLLLVFTSREAFGNQSLAEAMSMAETRETLASRGYRVVVLDAEKETALRDAYEVGALPDLRVLSVDRTGIVKTNVRSTGYVAPERLGRMLADAAPTTDAWRAEVAAKRAAEEQAVLAAAEAKAAEERAAQVAAEAQAAEEAAAAQLAMEAKVAAERAAAEKVAAEQRAARELADAQRKAKETAAREAAAVAAAAEEKAAREAAALVAAERQALKEAAAREAAAVAAAGRKAAEEAAAAKGREELVPVAIDPTVSVSKPGTSTTKPGAEASTGQVKPGLPAEIADAQDRLAAAELAILDLIVRSGDGEDVTAEAKQLQAEIKDLRKTITDYLAKNPR